MKDLEPILLVNSAMGIYIPSQFCSVYNVPCNFANYEDIKKDIEYIADEDNIGNDDYWEVWDSLIDDAVFLDTDNNQYYIAYNEDLWAIPVDYENDDFWI